METLARRAKGCERSLKTVQDVGAVQRRADRTREYVFKVPPSSSGSESFGNLTLPLLAQDIFVLGWERLARHTAPRLHRARGMEHAPRIRDQEQRHAAGGAVHLTGS
jgi:hypothetical protein